MTLKMMCGYYKLIKLNNKMERAAAEANIALMSKMLSICREKTLKKTHTTDSLSADEKKQF